MTGTSTTEFETVPEFRDPTTASIPSTLSLEMVTEIVTDEEVTSRQVIVYKGEGRCPVVPLVFKTSLGAVRSPEGSTPSLLRQSTPTS
jgi:hypothetical protein